MNVRFAILALSAFVFGCATETQPQQPASGAAAKSAAAPAPQRSRSGSLTGSRLPPMDDEDAGSSMVGTQSGSDYMHDRAGANSPKQ